MSSRGLVTWGEVKAMLDKCAPGYHVKESEEYYCVYYKDKSFPRLTRGSHRQRGKNSAEIQAGHIKKMARIFGIQDCAEIHIERLR